MADREIEVVIRGKNLSGDAFNQVQKDLGGIAEGAKKTSGAFDVAFGMLASTQLQQFSDAAGRFLTNMVEEASEAQNTMAQLESVIKSTGGAAGISVDEVMELADGFSDLTRFEDDAIAAGQTVLLQFTKIGKETFPAASKAVLDLAERMGMDLPSAARLVGKALEGEFAGLTRFGIVFDDQTKKTLDNLFKIGDTAKAQEIILSELEKRFGGAAEAAGKTLGGALDRLKNKWGEVTEAVALSLAENESFQRLIDSLIKLLDRLADGFSKLPEPVQLGIVALVGLVAILGRLAPALISAKILLGGAGIGGALAGLAGVVKGVLIGAFTALGTVVTAITAPVWVLIGALAVLTFTIVTLGPQALKTFRMMADIIAASLKRAGYEIKRFFTQLWYDLRVFASKLWTSVKTWFATVGKGIVDGIWSGIQTAWNTLKTNVTTALDELLKWIQSKIKSGSASVVYAVEVGKPIAQGIALGITQGVGLIQQAFDSLRMPEMAFSVAQPTFIPATASSPGFAGVSRSSTRINVGRIGNHGSLSEGERRWFDRRAEGISEKAILRTLK